MRKLTPRAGAALAAPVLVAAALATPAAAEPLDQYIVPIHHFEQQGNFNEVPNAGAVEIAPGVMSSAWQHETNPSNPFGGDLVRIWWKVNIPNLPVEPRLYALEWWDATPGSDNDFHIIESQFRGEAGDIIGVDPTVPWAGQFNSNKQWMKTNVSEAAGGVWRQAGPGPQAPSSPDYIIQGGNPSNATGNPGSNPPVSFMWLKHESYLYAKWDFNFGNPDGTFIDRTYAELRLTEIPVAGSTLYWDLNGTAAGVGGTSPSGNWNGTTGNFNKDPNGGGPAGTRAMTYPDDTINFAAGVGATGSYTVTVSGTRHAAQVNIQEGNVTFQNGTVAVGSFDVSAGATGTITSALAPLSNSLTKTGTGTLQLSKLPQNNAINITGGTVRVLHSAPAGAGTNPERGDNAFVSRTTSLTIAAGATLDVTNNDVIVDYAAGPNPAGDLEDLVAQGFNGGDWLGTGITSSTAAGDSNFHLAIADNALLAQPYGVSNGGPNFSGVDVPLNSVLIKFTHRVDLDLDGLVTPNDAAIFAGNYSENDPAYWAIGDLDYDEVFTPNDAAVFSGFYDEALTSLPEPASLGVIGLLSVSLTRRRRTT